MLNPSCPAIARLTFSRGNFECLPQRYLLLGSRTKTLRVNQVRVGVLRRSGRTALSAITCIFQSSLQTRHLALQLTPLFCERRRVIAQRVGYAPMLKTVLRSFERLLGELMPEQLHYLLCALQEIRK